MRAGALALLTTVLLTAALSACGESSSAGSSTTSASTTASAEGGSATATGTTQATTPSAAAPAAKSAGSPGSGSSAGTSAGSGKSAQRAAGSSQRPSGSGHAGAGHVGGAAAFLTPQGDNSIPEYGSEAPSAQRSEATAALRAYLVAREGGDWEAACAGMASPVRGQVEVLANASNTKVSGCEGAYAALSKYSPPSERANPLGGAIAALRVKADKAFALFYGPHNQQYMMPMVSEGGAWKVNQIAPVAYPIGAPVSAAAE